MTQPPQPKKRRLTQRVFALLSLALLLGVIASGLFIKQQLSPVQIISTPQEFEVLPGWGASTVAHELESAGLIRNARLFTLWLRYKELDRSVGEGLYDLDAAMSSAQIALRLAEGGHPRTVSVVIPEGFRARDVAARLEAAGLGDADVFEALIREPRELRPAFVPLSAGLEGFLFPASYAFPVKSTPEEVLGIMLQRFSDEMTGDNVEALLARELDVYDWVVLASMVQAEAGSSEEMPIIAGVFLNRLDDGMLLQSDPTVAYGLNKDLPELNVFEGDFKSDHAWNTYTRAGLPQSPINNPGSDALRAVLEPIRSNEEGVNYLYFIHGVKDGETIFVPTTNLRAHNQAVEAYLR